MIVKNFSIAQQDEKIRMAQAAGLYLLFVSEISPRERSESCEIFNTRTFENLRKIDCSVRAWENSVLRNRTRKLDWRKPQVCFRDIFGIRLKISEKMCTEISPKIDCSVRAWENSGNVFRNRVRNRVKFLIPGPLKICEKLILPNGREKIQYYVTGREN